ncbi:MAG: hypothetical protein QXG39_09810 [Candidatus Aenigmatarchaeota archaeon]
MLSHEELNLLYEMLLRQYNEAYQKLLILEKTLNVIKEYMEYLENHEERER